MTISLERSKIMLFVGIIGLAKIVVDGDGLDDVLHRIFAKGRHAGVRCAIEDRDQQQRDRQRRIIASCPLIAHARTKSTRAWEASVDGVCSVD
jgi:hypothetical protein